MSAAPRAHKLCIGNNDDSDCLRWRRDGRALPWMMPWTCSTKWVQEVKNEQRRRSSSVSDNRDRTSISVSKNRKSKNRISHVKFHNVTILHWSLMSKICCARARWFFRFESHRTTIERWHWLTSAMLDESNSIFVPKQSKSRSRPKTIENRLIVFRLFSLKMSAQSQIL